MIHVTKNILNYIYPPKCIFCGEVNGNAEICQECWKKIYWISQAQCCEVCGMPLKYKISKICESCLLMPPIYDRAISVFLYDDFSKKPILDFKNRDATYLSNKFAQLIYRNIKNYIMEYDIICIVPIFWEKLIRRRYNQCALMAKELAELCHKKYDPLILKKIVNTRSQEGLSREMRLQNVVGSFGVNSSKNITGKSIIIVDDVITTGSTANECAKILKANGATKVLIAAIAKVANNKMIIK